MLAGELDPHLESGTFSGQTVAEQILWSGASGRSPEIVRMALARIDWVRDDVRWFWMLWRPLPGHQDLNDAEQASCRESFRLILERCDPNLRAGESGQTMLHEVIARDHGVGVSLASMLLDAGARTDARDEFLKTSPGVGVSLGPCGAGQTAAGSRGRSDPARGRAVGQTARVGRTASTCGDCNDPPATRS